jgi:hypothetical protein
MSRVCYGTRSRRPTALSAVVIERLEPRQFLSATEPQVVALHSSVSGTWAGSRNGEVNEPRRLTHSKADAPAAAQGTSEANDRVPRPDLADSVIVNEANDVIVAPDPGAVASVFASDVPSRRENASVPPSEPTWLKNKPQLEDVSIPPASPPSQIASVSRPPDDSTSPRVSYSGITVHHVLAADAASSDRSTIGAGGEPSAATAWGRVVEGFQWSKAASPVPPIVIYHFARVNAVEVFGDALNRFINQSAAMGPALSRVMSPSHARAWTITLAVIAADATLGAYLFGTARRRSMQYFRSFRCGA